MQKMIQDPEFLIIDLFCGAGGTTTGFTMAENNIAIVIACVNHDEKAIESHWRNHPEVEHFNEDITKLYGYYRHGIFFHSDQMLRLQRMVQLYRAFYPNAKLILWASLECTNFSKAKGGLPRDADSRTLAEHLFPYQVALQPDYIEIENVVEFMSWGPLDENGKPVSRKAGADWLKWRDEMCKLGYYDDWQELNSADYGAYTSRNRLFGCFARPELPIVWPAPTHAKKTAKVNLFGEGLKPWNPVKDVLDFADEGESIFTRKKELSEKTLERIEAGLIKYVAKGDTAFISKYFSGRPAGKVNSVNDPASTVTTFGGQTLIQVESFISNYKSGDPAGKNSAIDQPIGSLTTVPTQSIVHPISILKYDSTDKTGKHYPPSLDAPAPVIIAQGRLGLIQGEFLTHYYGNGFNTGSGEPLPTITTKERSALVQPEYFLDKHYGKSSQNQSIDQPAGTILPTDKHRLVEVEPLYKKVQLTCDCGNSWEHVEGNYLTVPCPSCGGFGGSVTFVHETTPFIMPTNYDNQPKSIEEPLQTITANRKHHYIVNPSHGGHSTSTEAPCPVIVARQDKAPLYLVQCEAGPVAIAVYEGDSDCMIRIKQFMAVFGLVDIKMRMLRVHELLKIQGFPEGYVLCGNQSDQKKFIGNSVVPHVVKAWIEAMSYKFTELKLQAA
jgi:DNA (cytosine-5)-methyltransferase 1